MISGGVIPNERGIWIDCYNQAVNRECAGTIIAGINNKGHYWVTDMGKVGNIHKGQSGAIYNTDGVSTTICAGEGVKYNTKILEQPQVLGWTRDAKGEVVDWHPAEVANAVTAAKRDNTQNYVVIPANTAAGEQTMELGGVCDLSYPSSKTRRGRVQENGTVAPTLTTHTENCLRRIESHVRIRKLTPRECFRLMGVSDADIDKIQAAGISKSQQYKMAGNSIVVNTLAAIFRQLLIGNFNKVQQTEFF